MPNPDAIVTRTIRFDPPLEGREPREALDVEKGLAVDLGEDRRVRLEPDDPRSTGFATVLDEVAKQGLYAYVELEPGTERMVRLLIPTVGLVTDVKPAGGPEGGIEVTLHSSHARHRLAASGDDAAELERTLRAALGERRPVLLVEDFEGAIIDVRDLTPDPEGPLPPFPEWPTPIPPPRPWWGRWLLWPFSKLWWWIRYPWWWFRCPSAVKAQQIFDAMAATSCDPLTVPPPCIPFRYPDDGCWARANEMCRLMLAIGYTPAKVWIDGSLEVISANKPGCHVYWGWHVAPTICVRSLPWKTVRTVIDPSLFTTPVTETQWKGVQGDPSATLTDTDHTVYLRGWYPTDPGYVLTNQHLAQYRLALYNRSIQVGAPPYPCP